MHPLQKHICGLFRGNHICGCGTCRCERGVDPGNAGNLTGIKVRISDRAVKHEYTVNGKAHAFVNGVAGNTYSLNLTAKPFFVINDPQAEIIGQTRFNTEWYPSLAVKRSGNNTTVVLATVPFIPRDIFRNIFRTAGVHIYSGHAADVTYISKGLFSMHSGGGGRKVVRLPRQARKITRLLPEKTVFPAGDKIEFEMSKAETALFKIEY